MAEFDLKPESAFVDKIKLSSIILDKEGFFCWTFADLLRKVKTGLIEEEKISDSLEFSNCWRVLHEIFQFLEHNDITKYEKKNPKSMAELEKIFLKYETLNSIMTYEELQAAGRIIREVISLAGYHESTFAKEDDFDSEED